MLYRTAHYNMQSEKKEGLRAFKQMTIAFINLTWRASLYEA